MKIAIITDHIPSIYAHSINTMKHAKAFFKLGHKVKILTVKRLNEELNGLKTVNIYNLYAISKKLKFKFFSDYTPYYFEDVRFLGKIMSKLTDIIKNYLPNLWSFFDTEKKMSNFCRDTGVNLTYCRRSERTAFYNILNKIPTIIESHNVKTIDMPNMKLLLKLSNSKYFKGIVTVHEILKKKFIEQGVPKEKILVLEDAVDLGYFEKIEDNKMELRRNLGLPLDKKIVMYCGSLKNGKGIGVILETAKQLNNNIVIYIVGGTTKRNKYWKKKARKKNLKNIRFLGFKEGIQVPKYLKSADVLFMPYDLNEKNKLINIYTTSPLKLFEYMATKNPIISSKIPTIEKIVQHEKEALLAEPGNTDEIVKFIELLLNDGQFVKDLTNNAYNKVKNFTYLKRCEVILKKFGNSIKK